MERISVFGLGKVGLVLASCLARSGARVVGVDPNQNQIDSIRNGQIGGEEPGVKERLESSLDKNLFLTTDCAKAVRESNLSFIIVPTPSNALDGFSVRYVLNACENIGKALRSKDDYHIVAIVSTMLPGSSELIVMPKLEEASGRKIGDNLGYCYNPVFIALGEVVKGFVQPDYVLIGESDPHAGDVVLLAHQNMIKSEAPVARMLPVEAEIAKIASNTHETMRVSFANMLASLCSEIPNANVDRITNALSHRMGKRFFKGAVPYGGPCWPRDNRALAAFMDAVGVPSILPRTVDQFNEQHGKYILRKVLELTSYNSTLGLLGLSYKPGTPYIDCSFSVELAKSLTQEGRKVTVWDPKAMPLARNVLGDSVQYAHTGDDCILKNQVVVITNPMAELKSLNWELAQNRIVVDCWRCLDPNAASAISQYHPNGVGPTGTSTELMNKVGQRRFDLMVG